VREWITAKALLPDKQVPLKLLILPSFEQTRAVYIRRRPVPNEPVTADQGVPVPGQPEAAEYVVIASKVDWESADRFDALLNGRVAWKLPEGERDDLWRKALKVQSSIAPISKETMHSLAALWEKALLGARPPPHIERSCITEIRVDGADFVFANDRLDGMAPKIPGPRIEKLIKIGESLVKYVNATEAERPAMEEKLRADALELQQEFD
jgi:hypothetical protein